MLFQARCLLLGFLGGGERETCHTHLVQREKPHACVCQCPAQERGHESPQQAGARLCIPRGSRRGAPRPHTSADCKPGGGLRAASAHACPRLPTPWQGFASGLPPGSRGCALCHRSCSQPLPSRGDLGDSRRLTQQPEDQMQLFFHGGAGEHGPSGDHLVVDAPNTPRATAEALGLVMEKPCGCLTTPWPGLRFLEREMSPRSCVPSLLQVTIHP